METGHITSIDINEIVPIVDSILLDDDKDKDGYINWAEFISRQQQAREAAAAT